MLVRQWTTDDRDIVAMGADVDAGAMHPILPDYVEALIGQDAVSTPAIEAPPAEGTFVKSFRNRSPNLRIVAELQIAFLIFGVLIIHVLPNGRHWLLFPNFGDCVLGGLVIDYFKGIESCGFN